VNNKSTAISTDWAIPLSETGLKAGSVHLWMAWLDREICFKPQLQKVLSDDEIKRAQRFHFINDAHRYIVGRAILRCIIARYLKTTPGAIQFGYGDHGKPYLKREKFEKSITFNMSASHGVSLIAVGIDCNLGVDIELIRFIPEMEKIIESCFSESERAEFSAIPKKSKQEAFFVCWTRKEAFIKATGKGLYFPLKDFDVSIDPIYPARLLCVRDETISKKSHRIIDIKTVIGFAAALAVDGVVEEIKFWEWNKSMSNS
jgi:4'-phosphopantetheinyl transferase